VQPVNPLVRPAARDARPICRASPSRAHKKSCRCVDLKLILGSGKVPQIPLKEVA
jgi:hypothetical protein